MLKHFSFAIAIALLAGANLMAQEWGDLEGTFIYKGTPPTPPKLEVTKDPEFCGKHNLVDEAIVEHASAKQLIAEIEAMEVGDKLRDAKVKVLGEQISHHVEEEESELFPEVEGSEMDLEALGQRMADRKTELLKQLAAEGEIR